MSEVNRWSISAGGAVQNATGYFPEGQAPSTLNNGSRTLMAEVRRAWQQSNPEITATYASGAYALTLDRNLSATELKGIYSFIADVAASTASATLNINTTGAKKIEINGANVGRSAIDAKDICVVAYDPAGDVYEMIAPRRSPLLTDPTVISVNNASNEALSITQSGNGGGLIVTNTGTGDSFLVEDAASTDSTPFVIDNSGNVVVGHTASLAYASSTTPDLQVNAAGASQIGISRWSADTASNAFIFLKSRGAAIGTHGAVLNNDQIGQVIWYGSDGTSAGVAAASIQGAGEGTFSPTSGPGRLVFSTTASGATSVTERMRIQSDGEVNILGNTKIGGSAGDAPGARLDISETAAGVALRVVSTEAGAGSGPDLYLYRNSPSPADNDLLSSIIFAGEDSGDAATTYAQIRAGILDVTDTEEDGQLLFQVTGAGALTTVMSLALGVQVGSPTGGDKGAGTLNATAVYDDNVLLTDYVFDAFHNDVKSYSEAVDKRAAEFKREWFDISQYSDYWKAERRLPSLPDMDDVIDGVVKEPLGHMVHRLMETVEIQAVHIDNLNQRLKAIEA